MLEAGGFQILQGQPCGLGPKAFLYPWSLLGLERSDLPNWQRGPVALKRLQSQRAGCTHSPPLKQENKSARETQRRSLPHQSSRAKTHTSSQKAPRSEGSVLDSQPDMGRMGFIGTQHSPYSDGNSGCSLRVSAFSMHEVALRAPDPGLPFYKFSSWLASKTTRPRM